MKTKPPHTIQRAAALFALCVIAIFAALPRAQAQTETTNTNDVSYIQPLWGDLLVTDNSGSTTTTASTDTSGTTDSGFTATSSGSIDLTGDTGGGTMSTTSFGDTSGGGVPIDGGGTFTSMAASNLVVWAVNGMNGQTSAATNYSATGIVASAITLGSGLTVNTLTNAISGTGVDTSATTAAASLANNDFFELTVSPAANYSVNLTGLNAMARISSTGPSNAAWYWSRDNYATALVSTNAVSTGSAGAALNVSVSTNGITNSTTFRLVGWNSASSGGNFSIRASVVGSNPLVSGEAILRAASALTWDGGRGNGGWTSYSATAADQANWNGNNTPLDGDSLLFAGTTQTNTTNDVSSLLAKAIVFSNTAGKFAISGNAMTVSNGITNLSANGQTFSNTITLGAAQTFNASAGNLTFAGNITNGGNLLTVDGASNSAFGAVISGIGGLTKNGSGTATLNGANTHSGTTTVSAGTLALGNVNALQNSLLDTGSSGSQAVTFTVAGNNTYNISGLQGSDDLAIGGNTLSVGAGGGNTTYSGAISGSGGSVTKTGAGNLTLSGASSFTGTLSANQGAVILGSAGRLASGSSVSIGGGTLTLGGNESVTAFTITTGSTLDGSGTLTASSSYTLSGGTLTANLGGTGAATASTGTTSLNGTLGANLTVSGGTVNLGSADRISDSATVTVSSGTLGMGANNDTVSSFEISGTGTLGGSGKLTAGTYALKGGTVTANLGGGTATVTTGTTSLNGTLDATTVNVNSGTVNLGSADRLANGAAVTIAGGTLGMGTVNDTVSSFTMTSGTLGGSTGILTASTYALQGGTVNAKLGAGAITVSGGTNALGSAGRLDTSSTLTVNSGQLTLGGNETVASLAGAGGTLALNGANTLTVGGGNTSTSFSGAISGAGGGLTKTGTGTLTLSGANSYTGTTTVSDGELALGAANVMSDSSAMLIGGGVLNLGANNDTVNSFTMTSGTLGGSGTLTASTYALQGGTINAALGAGAVTVSTGTTTLGSGGRLNSSSTLTVNSGQLTLAGNETVASLAGAGGTLALNGANTLTVGGGNTSTSFSGAISGAGGGLTKTGTGALTLSADTSYTGATTISGGTLVYNGTNTGTAVAVNSGGTLAGSGSVGAVTVNSGGTMNPGNSPGSQTYASLTWEGGGNYNWQLYDADAVAGTGYDTFVSTGAFTINATSGNKYNINLWTLSGIGPDTNGDAVGFTAANNYSWTLGTFGSISGFSADAFSINKTATNGTSGFANFYSGTFSIDTNATSLLLVYTAPAASAVHWWIGGSGDWSDANNWSNNEVPTGDESIIFVTDTGGFSTNNTAGSLTGLLFTNGAGGFTVSGTNVTLGFQGVTNLSTAAQTIENNLTLGVLQNFDASAGDLTFGGTIDNGGYLLTVLGDENTTLNGAVSGSGGLTKSGSGTVILAGNNTFTGTLAADVGTVLVNGTQATTTINVGGGTLLLGGNNKLADGATLTLSSGTADFGGFSDTVGTFNVSGGTFTNGTATATTYGLSGGTVAGTLGTGTANVTGSVTLSGTANSTLNVNSGGALALSGSANGAVNVNTGGTLTLAANNRIGDSSAVTVNAGTLATVTFNDTVGSLVLTNSGSLTGSGTITAGTYTLNGGTVDANIGTGTATSSAGTTTLNGSLAGDLTMSGGTLNLGANDRLGNSSAVSISLGTLGMSTYTDTVGSFTITGGTLGGTTGKLTAATYTLNGGTVNAKLGAGTINSTTGSATLNGTADAATVNVSGGTLTLGASNLLDNAAAVTISSGTLGMSAYTDTVGSFTITGGTLGGGGTLTTSIYALQGGTVTANLGTGTINATGNTALNGTAAATTVNVSGSTLTLGSAGRLAAGATVNITNSGNLTIAGAESISALVLSNGTLGGSGQTLTASSYALQGGTVTANLGTGTATASTGTTTIDGNLGGALTGSGGTANLNGTVAGNVTVSGGTVNLGSADRIGNSSSVTVSSGALNLGGNDQVGAVQITGGTIGGSGALTGSSYDVQAGTISAALAGSGAMTKSGSGTVILSGSSSGYSGAINVQDGGLVLGNNNALGSSAVTLTNGSIQAANGVTIGNGFTIGTVGANTTNFGSTTVLAGWDFNGTTGGGTNNTPANTLASGVVNGTGLTRGSGVTVPGSPAGRAWGGQGWDALSQAAAITAGDYITFTLTADPTKVLRFNSVDPWDYRRTSTGPPNGALQYSTDGITFTDINNSISYTSTATGGSTLSAISLGSLSDVASGTTITFRVINWGASAGTGTWYFYDVGTDAGTDDFAIRGQVGTLTATAGSDSGTLGISEAGAATFTGAITNNSTATLTAAANGQATFSGVISGVGNITKSGSGTVILSGSNSYAGATTISNGTLQIGDGGTTGSISTTSGVTNDSTLAYNRSDNLTAGYAITGGGSLVKLGGGTVILAGNNTYGGATTISAGTLQVGNGGTSGSIGSTSGVVVTNGSTLAYNRSDNLTASYAISGGGSLVKLGGGTVILAGNNGYTGATTISAGTLQIGNGGTSGSIASTSGVSNEGTLAYNRSDNLTASYAISGGGALIKAGAGTLTLAGNNSYAGSTSISNGAISISADNNLGAAPGAATAGNVTLNGGKLLSTATFTLIANRGIALGAGNGIIEVASGQNLSYGGVAAGTGGLTKLGAGTLTISGANTYSGGTLVTAGTLVGDTTSLRADNLTNNATLVYNQTTNNDVDVQGLRGNGLLVKEGSGTLQLGASGNYAGNVSLNNGAIALNSASAFGTNTVTINSGTAIGTISNASRNIANNFVFAGDFTAGLANVSSNGNTVITGTVDLNGGTRTITLRNALGLNNTVSNGGLVVAEAVGNTNMVNPYLNLAASNSFAGGVTLNSGNLRLSHANGAGAGSITQTDATSQVQINVAGTITNSMSVYNVLFMQSGELSGALTLNNTVFSVTNNVTGTLSSNLSGGSSLTKTGSGTIILSGANDYSGGTVVSAGALRGNTASLQGAISNGTVVIFDQAVDGTYSGVLSGGGALIKTNSGTLILTNENSQGGTTIGQGTLQIGAGGTTGSLAGAITNNGTLAYNRSDNLTQATVISGSGAVTKAGSGTLTLSQANSYSGSTTISAGAIRATAAAALGGTGGSTTVASGAALELSGDVSFNAEALTISGDGIGGAGALRNISGANTNTGFITLAANSRINADAGSLVINTAGSDANAITGDFNLALGGAGNFELRDRIAIGTGVLTKDGSGTLTFISAPSQSGGTVLSAGTLQIGFTTNNALGLGTGTLALNGGILSGNNATARSLNNNVTIGGNVGFGGTNTAAITLSGTVDLGAANRTLDVSNTTTLSGAVSGVGGGITKAGSGTIILSASNNYDGGTALNAGVLRLQNADAAGTGAITQADGTSTLEFNVAGTITNAMNIHNVAFSQGATLSGPLTLNSTTVSVAAATTGTISSDLSGGGSITKTGTGTIILGGANDYSGGTVVSAGGLRGNTGSLQGTITNNAAVIFDQAADGTYGGLMSGLGSLTKESAGTLTLAGANTYGGGTTINGGAVKGDTTSLQGNISVASGTKAIFDQTGTGAYTNALSGNGSLTKMGSGTVILSSANSYSGGTTLSGGKLVLSNTTAAGTGTITQTDGTSTLEIDTTGTVANAMSIYNISTLQSVTLSGNKTLNNATYTVAANTTTTDSGNLTGGGGVTKEGTGTLILTGNNNYTGAVAVNAGLLNLNSSSGGAAATTSSVSVASGATLLISQSNQVNDSASVSLSGGTITRASGVSETFGALTVSGSSYLDFGTGTAGNLTFGTYTPSSLLTVNSFFSGNTLVFGSDLTGYLAPGTYGTNSFSNSYFTINSISGGFTASYSGGSFTITAIPEPSAYAAAVGLIGLMMWPSRRRLLKDVKKILGLTAPMRDRLARR